MVFAGTHAAFDQIALWCLMRIIERQVDCRRRHSISLRFVTHLLGRCGRLAATWLGVSVRGLAGGLVIGPPATRVPHRGLLVRPRLLWCVRNLEQPRLWRT